MIDMRDICVVVDSRANWSRGATVIEAVDNHPNLNLRFIVCSKFASEYQHFTDRKPDNVLDTYRQDDSPFSMVEYSANLLTSLSSAFRNNRPDVVVALTDRYETLVVAALDQLVLESTIMAIFLIPIIMPQL